MWHRPTWSRAIQSAGYVVPEGALEAAVAEAAGESAGVAAAGSGEEGESREEKRYRATLLRFWFSITSAVLVMVLSMPLMDGHGALAEADPMMAVLRPLAHGLEALMPVLTTIDPTALEIGLFALTLAVMVVGGGTFYAGAWRSLRHGSANMNTLIALGTGAAFLFSAAATFAPGLFRAAGLPADVYYEAVAWILALVLTGQGVRGQGHGPDVVGDPAAAWRWAPGPPGCARRRARSSCRSRRSGSATAGGAPRREDPGRRRVVDRRGGGRRVDAHR